MVLLSQIVTALSFFIAIGYILWSSHTLHLPTFENAWMIPAIVCVLITYWTVYTLITAGIWSFWMVEQSTTGVQLWCSLWIAISLAWNWLLPEARKLNMNVMVWAVLVLCTGSIGLSAMLARIMFIKERSISVSLLESWLPSWTHHNNETKTQEKEKSTKADVTDSTWNSCCAGEAISSTDEIKK